MEVMDVLPTITSIEELDGYLAQGRLMKAVYTVDEWAAIEYKKIELKKAAKK